ncbi:MAG: hypothetical protein IPJ07_20460 [Acidobacteria bacterium]|nr:hypothetical protein [Acidobacteriota bacterium]
MMNRIFYSFADCRRIFSCPVTRECLHAGRVPGECYFLLRKHPSRQKELNAERSVLRMSTGTHDNQHQNSNRDVPSPSSHNNNPSPLDAAIFFFLENTQLSLKTKEEIKQNEIKPNELGRLRSQLVLSKFANLIQKMEKLVFSGR